MRWWQDVTEYAKRAVDSIFGDRAYLEDIDDPFRRPISRTGEVVNLANALGYPAMRQAVTLISGDVAKVECAPYRQNDDGSCERDKTHHAFKVAAWMPNDRQSAYHFRRHMMVHALIYTHAYAWIHRNPAGEVVKMIPLLSDRTERIWVDDADLGAGGYRYVTEINEQVYYLPESEVFHLSGMHTSVNGGDGDRVLTQCRDSIGLCLAANNFASRFFRKGGRIGGVLEIPSSMTQKAKDALEQGWRTTYEQTDSQFATVILRDNAKFHAAQFDPDKSQLTMSRQEQVKEAARIFNIPAHKLGHDGRTAYNSLEMEERAYLNSTLSHWFHAWEAECNLKLLTEPERESMDYAFAHDISELISTDRETLADVHTKYVDKGILTVDEVRREMKLPAIQVEAQQEVPDMPMEVQSSLRAALSAQIGKASAALAKRVKDEAKRKVPGKFTTWFNERFDDNARIFEAEAGNLLDAIAYLENTKKDEVRRTYVAPEMDSLKAVIQKTIDNTTRENMRAKIIHEVTKWHENRNA